MVVFLLLVIIAIMLLGSQPVLGVIAWAGAIVVGICALALAMGIWNGLSHDARIVVICTPIVAVGFVMLCALCLIFKSDLKAAGQRPRKPSSASRQKALAVWQTFDQDMIDRFSRSALKQAHEALGQGELRRMVSIYEAECERIRSRSREPQP